MFRYIHQRYHLQFLFPDIGENIEINLENNKECV